MRAWAHRSLIVFVLLVLSIAPALAEPRTVQVGIYNNVPLVYVGENGRAEGLAVDVLRPIAEREGWRLEFVPCEWTECLAMLGDGRIDLQTAIIGTPEREKTLSFTDSFVFNLWGQVYAEPNHTFETILDLEGKRVGIYEGSVPAEEFLRLLDGFGVRPHIVRRTNYRDLATMLQRGEIDAAVFIRSFAEFYSDKFRLARTPIVFSPLPLRYATAKGQNTDLLKTIDKYLGQWKGNSDSPYFDVLEAIFGRQLAREKFPIFAYWIGGGIVSLLGLAWVAVIWLRRKVDRQTRELQVSERRFRHLFENAEISIWNEDLSKVYEALGDLRLQGVRDLRRYLEDNKHVAWEMVDLVKVVHVNEATLKLFSAKSENHILHQIGETFGPNAIEVFVDELCAIWEKRSEFRAETTFRTLDGGTIEAIISMRFPDTAEGSRNVPVSIIDITERKLTEAALLDSEERNREIVENALDAIVSIDSEGIVTQFNPAAERIFGYQRNEAIGKNMAELIIPRKHRERHARGFKTFLETGKGKLSGRTFEIDALRSDGKEIRVEISLSPTRKPVEDVCTAFIKDITHRRSMEAQLRHAQKMEAVGQLTGGLAHDLNNALSIISINVGLLNRLRGADKKSVRHFEAAMKGVERASDFTRKMLDFSRTEIVETKRVSVNGFVQGMESMISKSLTPAIILEVALSEDPWLVDIDSGDFEASLVNLALNARDAMPDGGTLVVETANKVIDQDYVNRTPGSSAGEFVMISVSDTGTGMTPEAMEKAFDPFFTTKEVGKGTGLDLSMVYGFVQRSGGHVKVYSEQGKGTTVRLYLPRASGVAENEDNQPSDGDHLPGGSETVLVVDDEEELVDAAVSFLNLLGYRTVTATGSKEALGILQQDSTIDLLFSDVIMPGGMDGYRLAIAALKDRPDLKVLLTSGFTRMREELMNGDRLKTSALAKSLLHKPYNIAELAVAVRRSLDA